MACNGRKSGGEGSDYNEFHLLYDDTGAMSPHGTNEFFVL